MLVGVIGNTTDFDSVILGSNPRPVTKPKQKYMTIENIAQVCHEVNKSFCIAMDDFSQLSWEDAPDWQKNSAINGVKFHLDNPLAGPEASHDSWMAEKLENGWKLGHVKDANEKTHPCILPFSQLPKEQQAKDYLFRQVVHSLSIHLEKQLTSY